MSLDDLDVTLFEDEANATYLEKQQQVAVSNTTKRFPWYWKHSLPVSNAEDTEIRKMSSSSSLESCRRGSVCSNQNSPHKSSPKRNKEHSKKNLSEKDEDHNLKTTSKTKKQHKESTDLAHENKVGSASHLYSVLEEQFLGEIIHESMENLYLEGNKSVGFHTSATLSTNTWY